MTSGPVVAMILEGENAVAKLREVVGNTDPHIAAEGTVRYLFGVDKQRNSIHAADSIENAKREIELCFSKLETV
jgi:nucleoside-diphosphate kinase